MKTKTPTLLVLISLLSLGVLAQAKRRPTATAKPKPVAAAAAPCDPEKDVQIKKLTAEVEDLKQKLQANEEAEVQKLQEQAKTAASSSLLSIQAGAIMKSGQVNPIARTTFYLLPKSATEIIMTRENYNIWASDLSRFGTRTPFEKWSLYEAALYMTSGVSPNFARAAVESLKKETLQTMVTGFDGIGRFENRFPSGEYFIFGVTKVGKDTAVWNLKVNVQAGERSVILDNNNMAN